MDFIVSDHSLILISSIPIPHPSPWLVFFLCVCVFLQMPVPIIPELTPKRTSTPRVNIQHVMLRKNYFSSEINFWKSIQLIILFSLFSVQLIIYYIIPYARVITLSKEYLFMLCECDCPLCFGSFIRKRQNKILVW